MCKGRFGICLWFYAVVGFVLVVMDELLPLVLLLGFVIAAEQNEWAIKQVIQALIICVSNRLLKLVPCAIFAAFSGLNIFSGALAVMFYAFKTILFLTVLALAAVGAVNALRGSDRGIPGISAISDRILTAYSPDRCAPADSSAK